MVDETTTPAACLRHHDPVRGWHLSGYLMARRAQLRWLVSPDGDVCCGVDGLYAADRRLLSLWRISIDDRTLSTMVAQLFSTDGMRVVNHISAAEGQSQDPRTAVTRIRVVRTYGAGEQIQVVNRGSAPFTATLRLWVSSDLATFSDLQAGTPRRLHPWNVEQGTAVAQSNDIAAVMVRIPPGADVATPRPDLLQLSWRVEIKPGGSWRTVIVIRATFEPP